MHILVMHCCRWTVAGELCFSEAIQSIHTNTRQYKHYKQYMQYMQYILIPTNTCNTYNTCDTNNTYQYKPIHTIQVNTSMFSILAQYIRICVNTYWFMHKTYQYKNTSQYRKSRQNCDKLVLCLYWDSNTILKFQYRQYRHARPVMLW